VNKILSKFGPFLGLLLVIALFSIPGEVREYFLSVSNFKIILTQTVIVALAALGMTMIIVSGGIDLSAGSVIAFTSVIGALGLKHGWSAWAGLRMTPFIITLGMMGIARGAGKWMASNETVNYTNPAINGWMTTADPYDLSMPPGAWVAVALAIATAIFMRRTVFGRQIFAIGSNEATARLCGVNTVVTKALIYTIAGGFFGLAGLMQLARLRQGDPTVAIGVELDIIAAVIIGGASLSGGAGSILGTMIGALIMSVLRNGSQQMGWPTYFQEIMIGVVIIVAVFLDRLRAHKSA